MREARRHEMGIGGYCVCPRCDYKAPHHRGTPCQDERCPTCDVRLLREGSQHHKLLIKKKNAGSSQPES